MKIFNIEIGKRKPKGVYEKAPNGGGFVSRWARPPSRNTSEWLDMFSKSPRLAVVDRIASDISNVDGHLYRINEDGTETEITNHPFLDFMNEPNPLYEMTSSAVWRLHEIYLLLVGEGFFLIERDNNGLPVELWNVPPHWVKMTPYLGSPTYTILSPGGLSMTVPVDDMFVMKRLNPFDPYARGLGQAESIADEVEIDEYTAQFQKRFFYNDATPSVVFLMPDATSEQRDGFMAMWNQKHKGVYNSHKAAALTGDVTVKEIGAKEGKNLGFLESRIAMRDAVLEHFGVPREIMGITENSNRATADSAQYIYAKNVLTPKIADREKAINRQLLPMFGDNLVWRYDPVIPYDKDFNKEKAIDGYNSGLITKNEGRNLIDQPPIEGGDVFKISTKEVILHDNDDPAEVSQNLQQESSKKSRHTDVEAFLRKEAQIILRDEKLFEEAISRHFSSQLKAIEKTLGFSSKADDDNVFEELEQYLLPDGTLDPIMWSSLSPGEQQLIIDGITAGLLNWEEEVQKLTDIFAPLWKKAYEDGADLNKENYGLQGISRPDFVSAAKVNGGKRVTGIEQTTRDNIANIIADGVSEGKSQAELKKDIQEEMKTTGTRAKLIARQETMTALATGQYDMMKEAGASEKTWHHRPQKNPRDGKNGTPNHIALDGETRNIDETFSNGLRYPRDPEDNRPEELINCRCYLTYGGF